MFTNCKNFIIDTCRQSLRQRFIRFLLVGGLNTVFGYGVWAFLIFIGLHYMTATAIGTIIGILFNFKTTGCLVFRNHNNRLLWRFLSVYGIVYLLNIALLRGFELLNINLYIAGLIILLPLAGVSFFLMRCFVFKERK